VNYIEIAAANRASLPLLWTLEERVTETKRERESLLLLASFFSASTLLHLAFR